MTDEEKIIAALAANPDISDSEYMAGIRQHDEVYKGLSPAGQKAADKIIEEAFKLPEDERHEFFAQLKRESRQHLQEKITQTDAQLQTLRGKFRKILRDWGISASLTSASDIESVQMAFANLRAEKDRFEDHRQLIEFITEELQLNTHLWPPEGVEAWSDGWRASGFAKMACGHKLAAALMLTNCPADVAVEAPWKAWSLYVPNGLLVTPTSEAGVLRLKSWADQKRRALGLDPEALPEGFWNGSAGRGTAKADDKNMWDTEVVRIWCCGSEPLFVVEKMPKGIQVSPMHLFQGIKSPALIDLICNYVKGVCLTLDTSNLERYQKPSSGHKGERHRRPGVEPAAGTQYELGSPVTIDLREEVKRFLAEGSSGRSGKHSPPHVQFLVRGHWRNQACGPGRVDHRHIWIEPFWKGPEDARVLLRTHSIKKVDQP